MDAVTPLADNPIDELEKRSDDNLRLWRLTETTDPDKVKPVTIGGRSFTSIDSYYQIKRATEVFGPLGQGWGWELDESVVEVDGAEGRVNFAKCKLTLWYVPPGSKNGKTRVSCGPVVGMNQLVSNKGRPDDEAFKKATTDAVTKALSYLGFSADVFMGLYDDNKYVNRLREEYSRKAEQSKSKLPEVCVRAVELLPKVRDLAELGISWKALTADLKKLQPQQLDYMKARFAMRKRQLGGAELEDSGPPEADGSDPERQ